MFDGTIGFYFTQKAQLVCYCAVPGLLVEVEVKTFGFVVADKRAQDAERGYGVIFR